VWRYRQLYILHGFSVNYSTLPILKTGGDTTKKHSIWSVGRANIYRIHILLIFCTASLSQVMEFWKLVGSNTLATDGTSSRLLACKLSHHIFQRFFPQILLPHECQHLRARSVHYSLACCAPSVTFQSLDADLVWYRETLILLMSKFNKLETSPRSLTFTSMDSSFTNQVICSSTHAPKS